MQVFVSRPPGRCRLIHAGDEGVAGVQRSIDQSEYGSSQPVVAGDDGLHLGRQLRVHAVHDKLPGCSFASRDTGAGVLEWLHHDPDAKCCSACGQLQRDLEGAAGSDAALIENAGGAV